MRALARPAVLILAAAMLVGATVPAADRASAHDPFPHVVATLTNTTGQPANYLRVTMGNVGASLNPVQANAPGCPAPTVVIDSLIPISRYVIVWPSECVDPGELITFHSDIDCTPGCQAPTIASYLYQSTFASFENDTSAPRSGLHVELAAPSQKVPPIVSPPGCSPPTVTPPTPPFSVFDVAWPSACVDIGETVMVDLYQFPYIPVGGTYGVGCTTCDPPAVASYDWIPDPVGGFVEIVRSGPKNSDGIQLALWGSVALLLTVGASAFVVYRHR